ncbi:MAG: phosphoribosylamine--glycine ligase, partial [Halobacteria archaeon]|nr:phosphoribosylamine--glycine ligase [Halobacteria archaeon]
MKILVIGSGGREHAITRALAQDDTEIYAAVTNRNPGIVELAADVRELDTNSPAEIGDYADEVGAELAVVGPEAPLQAGVVDELEERGVYAFGPKKKAARIETDKAWARRFMQENDITGTPDFAVFEDVDEACAYVDEYNGDVAVKPHGLTGGKGVRVTGDQLTKQEAKDYMRDSDWDDWVIEERLVGEEFTLQAFVANGEIRATPAVQDHKRAYEGDEGPNTGGMGSYNDAGFVLPFMNQDDYDAALGIMEETVEALPDYRGILYGQFMLTDEGPKVVEFNARFGDPEAMNVLPILDTDFVDVIEGARDGAMPEVGFERKATVCKYAVPEGYPTNPEGGTEITLSEEEAGDALVFYASVDEKKGELYTTTSRSLAVVGVGDTIEEAEEIADDALSILGDGLRVRHDIGKPELVQKRIDHMET